MKADKSSNSKKNNKKNNNKNISSVNNDKNSIFVSVWNFIKKHIKSVICIAVTVVILAVSAVLVVFNLFNLPDAAVMEYHGENATSCTVSQIGISEKNQLEKYDEIKHKIHGDRSKFKFYANDYVQIEETFLEGTLIFGNMTTNKSTMLFVILDEEGDVIYRSMGIEAGEYLPRIDLIKNLTFGKHNCKLYVSAFDPKSYELIGTQWMKLTVEVGTEYDGNDDEFIIPYEQDTTTTVVS